jgi:hypothetical protein
MSIIEAIKINPTISKTFTTNNALTSCRKSFIILNYKQILIKKADSAIGGDLAINFKNIWKKFSK